MLNALECRLPPPLVFALAAGLMILLEALLPGLAVVVPAAVSIAAGLTVAGLAWIVAGALACRRARTTISPLQPAASTCLITGGVFRLSRNPMYLGLALVLAAGAVLLGHPGAVVVIAGFVLYLQRFQIQPEERALERRFGRDFTDYRRRTRRWI